MQAFELRGSFTPPAAPDRAAVIAKHETDFRRLVEDVQDIVAAKGEVSADDLAVRGWPCSLLAELLPDAIARVVERAERQISPATA